MTTEASQQFKGVKDILEERNKKTDGNHHELPDSINKKCPWNCPKNEATIIKI